MNKLYVFQDRSDEYARELECAYGAFGNGALKMDIKDLSLDYLAARNIHIIISNGLPKEWYYMAKGLNIIAITLDRLDTYFLLADIVIDFQSKDGSKYFTGEDYSLRKNKYSEFVDITDLITKLQWDSDFFGFPVAFLSSRYLTENIMLKAERFIREENIRLVEYLCNCHDKRSVEIAEKNGFHFTDVRLSFEKVLKEKAGIGLPEGYTFGRAKKEDIGNLQLISENLYKDSRYFFDEHFDTKKVNEFYKSWIERAVLGLYDDECFCLYVNQATPVAFCSLKYNAPAYADIGLFGLAQEYRGSGLGRSFLHLICDMLADKKISKLYVVTQGRNYAAQRLYQKAGFLTRATELWYHKWI